ncbi:hypothetical protein K3495_g2298 [Podosphaera aphanis]|nr:hypothetical protein K3495_g2298 [Podosphaera aphanis]
MFKDGIAIAQKINTVFEAPLYNDLYQLMDQNIQKVSKLEHSFSAHQLENTSEIPIPIDEMSRTHQTMQSYGILDWLMQVIRPYLDSLTSLTNLKLSARGGMPAKHV